MTEMRETAEKSTQQKNQRINMIGSWLQRRFGEKVVKLSLDGGFTCPNRDGTKGVGGCIFCSPDGSGELSTDIPGQIQLLAEKWPNVHHYLAYFQSHTSTYAPIEKLEQLYTAALSYPLHNGKIVGLVIATRPDCLGDDVIQLLKKLQQATFLWVELGLQTTHGDSINRCYPLSTYNEAVDRLHLAGIPYVTHLILGLPGETHQQMKESVEYVCSRPLFGLKLHLMNVIKNTTMNSLYPNYQPFSSPEEYISLVCDLLEIIPPEVTIHRLTGDVPRKLLVSPPWSYKKRTILNGISQEMKRRNSFQGCKLEKA